MFKRIFFSEKEQVRAIFSYLGNGDFLMSTTVLDLSENGLGLTLPKIKCNGLRSGDVLMLRKIIGNPHLYFIRNLKTEIRWILHHDFLDHLGFGCRFIQPPPTLQNQLHDFMNFEGLTMRNAQ